MEGEELRLRLLYVGGGPREDRSAVPVGEVPLLRLHREHFFADRGKAPMQERLRSSAANSTLSCGLLFVVRQKALVLSEEAMVA